MKQKANKKRIKFYQIMNNSYFLFLYYYNNNQIKSNIQSKFDWIVMNFY